MHNAVERILEFFSYSHLPDWLQEVSKDFWQLADTTAKRAPDSPETTVALRKLLEAKDAAVRASLSVRPPVPRYPKIGEAFVPAESRPDEQTTLVAEYPVKHNQYVQIAPSEDVPPLSGGPALLAWLVPLIIMVVQALLSRETPRIRHRRAASRLASYFLGRFPEDGEMSGSAMEPEALAAFLQNYKDGDPFPYDVIVSLRQLL